MNQPPDNYEVFYRCGADGVYTVRIKKAKSSSHGMELMFVLPEEEEYPMVFPASIFSDYFKTPNEAINGVIADLEKDVKRITRRLEELRG